MFQSCMYQMVQKKHNFDVSKPCALCGQSGHSFDSCPQVDLSVMKPAYIKLRLLANRIRAVLNDLEKQLLKRIQELEAEIAVLKAQMRDK